MKNPLKQSISNCGFCGKEFEHYKSRPRKYCSTTCAVTFMRGKAHPRWKSEETKNRVNRVCENCKKGYTAYKDRCVRFCSSACSVEFLRGEKHPKWKAENKNKTCVVCAKTYNGRGRLCCSPECAGLYKSARQMGPNNPFWHGGRQINRQGYVLVLDPKKQSKSGYVLEHRLVMEQLMGRELWPFEIVHHKNAVKHDNRIENLEVLTHATHAGQVLCPRCDYVIQLH